MRQKQKAVGTDGGRKDKGASGHDRIGAWPLSLQIIIMTSVANPKANESAAFIDQQSKTTTLVENCVLVPSSP